MEAPPARPNPFHRVRTLAVTVAAMAGLALAPAAEGAGGGKQAGGKPSKGKRPNVVVVMTDDQDFRSMGALPKTKRFFRHHGTTFTQNIVNLPLCCPSRATFLTGQYAHNHGVEWNNFPQGGYRKLEGAETLPVWLRRAGYRTIHVGKYLNEYGEDDPLEVPPGWTDWHGGVDPSTYDYYGYTINHNGKTRTYGHKPSDYSTDVFGRIARRAVRRSAAKRRPFFLNLAPIAPHTVAAESGARIEGTPALPPPRYESLYADAEMPRYPNFNELDISDKPTTLAAFFPNPLNDKEVADLEAHYRGRMGALAGVDDMVARLLKTLRRTGELRNTVIAFTSDNGWILGEHRLRDPITVDGTASGVKYVPYEGSSRVPLMIAGPGFGRHREVRGVTSNADLPRTIVKLAGAKATLPQDGLSLLGPARKPKRLDGRGVLIQTAPNPRNVPAYKAIRTERYRYEVQEDGQEGLYDLERDPWELESAHDDPAYAEIRAILREALFAIDDCSGRSCRIKLPPLPPPGR